MARFLVAYVGAYGMSTDYNSRGARIVLQYRVRPTTVEQALRDLGFWYPPDAIAAVREGRSRYHPFDNKMTYGMTDGVRNLIQTAIDTVEGKNEHTPA